MTPDEQKIYDEGRRYFDQNRLDDAARCFLSLVEGWPNYFPDVYNKLGFIFYQQERLEDAVNYLEKALSINSHYTEASLNLVIAYNELGRYEEAQQSFNKAARVLQTSPTALDPYIEGKLANEHAHLADQYYDLNRYQEAVSEYKKALTLRPRFVDVITKLGRAYRDMGELDHAVKTFQKALKINAGYTQARTHLGITYYMKGFVDMAIAEWAKAREMDPQNRDVQIYLTLLSKTAP
jgi:tetratricopeptide (TPR) repeat protein